jgi:hypothetical protein
MTAVLRALAKKAGASLLLLDVSTLADLVSRVASTAAASHEVEMTDADAEVDARATVWSPITRTTPRTREASCLASLTVVSVRTAACFDGSEALVGRLVGILHLASLTSLSLSLSLSASSQDADPTAHSRVVEMEEADEIATDEAGVSPSPQVSHRQRDAKVANRATENGPHRPVAKRPRELISRPRNPSSKSLIVRSATFISLHGRA